ncbi:MarR family winged helix-turn-helix transcriptional regulator [Actinokineospora enzanensis]|uniref:MarR family winged helix-turn-helix transcriptional regulator n=1 Tax=Actinokineospora enzanensis TaxID=155975 RepID=UPI000374C476|nr:MarR family transcriptional regulator [Actinokineospora enzanensis]
MVEKTSEAPPANARPEARGGAAFLLTQLGTHVAQRFADRTTRLGVTPPQLGVLWWLRQSPGQSQQALARHFGLQPSRVVTFVDELEDLGLAARGRDPHDRRVRTVSLTELGERTVDAVGRAMAEHEDEVTAPLSTEERRQLVDMLIRLAAHAGLSPGVHPGFRSLGRA